jgi:CHAD domain-containing protein
LKKGKFAGLQAGLRAVSGHLQALCEHPVSQKAVETAVSGAAGVAFVRATERFLMIDRNDPATIHQFRLSFKKFRYTLEALRPLLPSITEGHLKAMNEYQQKMGDIQDLEVLRSMIDAYAVNRGMKKDPGIIVAQNELIHRRAVLVDRFMVVAGDFYRFWPSEFQEMPIYPSRLRMAGV